MRSRPQQPQQQIAACGSVHFSKQHSLLPCVKGPIGGAGAGSFRESLPVMVNYGANGYDRDESPVSVISHSATIVSQPSSACASMEHPGHLLARPCKQRSVYVGMDQSPQSHSTATSGASTSEDDSAFNCNMSKALVAAHSQGAELPSPQTRQKPDYCKERVANKSCASKHHNSCEEAAFGRNDTSTQPFRSTSIDSQEDDITDAMKTEVDCEGHEHMFSIDLQGRADIEENSLKRSGICLNGRDKQKLVSEPVSAISKIGNGEPQENQWNRNNSPSNARKDLLFTRPFANWLTSKVVNHTEITGWPRATAPVAMSKYEAGPLKATAKAFYITPSVISRQRSLHCGGLAVPSKWDDAEKWLCYDNRHVSQHQNEVKSSSVSRQTSLTSTNSTPNSGERVGSVSKRPSRKEESDITSVKSFNVDDKNFECRSDQSSSSSREKYSFRKVRRNAENADTQSMLARHSLVQNVMVNSNKLVPLGVGSATSRGHQACSPQSSSSNDMVGNGLPKYSYLDPLLGKGKVFPAQANAVLRNVSNYASGGEIAIAELMLNRRSSAVSVSDGEISRQVSCRQYCSGPPLSASADSPVSETKMKDGVHPTSFKHWIRDNVEALRTAPCKSNFGTNGTDTMRRPTCASDGDVCESEAPGKPIKGVASYTQRFKQHQILQKLRRKCSQRQGASLNTTVRKAGQEVEGNGSSANARLQSEFMVQTPTHGRSASMKDACTEVSPSLSRRDMGTQVTPAASSPATSKSASPPLQNTSPARHNTPTRVSPTPNGSSRDSEDETNSRCNDVSALALGSCHWAKLELRQPPPRAAQTYDDNSELGSVNTEWSPAYGLEEDIAMSKDVDEGHSMTGDDSLSDGIITKRTGGLAARAAAWEEAERIKLSAKFKREEARISAWENLQKAKAESDLKKLEVKLEKLRSKATEKVMSRVASAQKRAEEMRAAAELQQVEQIRKVREKACSLGRNAIFPGGFTVCFARSYLP